MASSIGYCGQCGGVLLSKRRLEIGLCRFCEQRREPPTATCPVCGGSGVVGQRDEDDDIDFGSKRVNEHAVSTPLEQQLDKSVHTNIERRLRDAERRLSALDGGPMPPPWHPALPEGEQTDAPYEGLR